MISYDFPRILGKSAVYLIQPARYVQAYCLPLPHAGARHEGCGEIEDHRVPEDVAAIPGSGPFCSRSYQALS